MRSVKKIFPNPNFDPYFRFPSGSTDQHWRTGSIFRFGQFAFLRPFLCTLTIGKPKGSQKTLWRTSTFLPMDGQKSKMSPLTPTPAELARNFSGLAKVTLQ